MKKTIIVVLKIFGIFILVLSAIVVPINAADLSDGYYSIDISGQVNAAFSPNPIGTDETDYLWVTPGSRSYVVGSDTIPFNIIDPSMNNGEGIIISNGGASGDPAYSYSNSFEIPVPTEIQKSVKKVYLLGIASGWGAPEYSPTGTIGATIRFIYDDGTEIIQPLRAGLEYDDWGSNHFASNSILVDSGQSSSGSNTHIDIFSIDTQSGYGKSLTKIIFQDTGTIAAIPIFAITIDTGQPPVAAFEINKIRDPAFKNNKKYFGVKDNVPMVGGLLEFNASKSYSPIGSRITEYCWDFDEGGASYCTDSPTTKEILRMPKLHSITLTITDENGLENSTSIDLNLNNLKPGDILLIRTSHWNIPFDLALDDYTHAGLYYGGDSVMECALNPAHGGTNAGCQLTKLSGYFYNENNAAGETFVTVYRVKSADNTIIQNALNWAEYRVHWQSPYDLMVWQKDINGDAWYCSEFIWGAYYSGSSANKKEINLGNKPKLIGVRPDDLAKDKKNLEYVASHWELWPHI